MTLQYFVEHLAVVFGAVTGALAARGKSIDLFGVIVLGLVTAVGGGTLRDLLLDVPVFWTKDSAYLITGFLAALVMFFSVRMLQLPTGLLQVADAFFLAFVVMLGTAKTWNLGHSWPICIVMGVATGVAGGILRDVLCGQIPMVFRSHIDLYATAAMIGTVVYLIGSSWHPKHPSNLIAGVLTIVVLRLAAVRWRIRLPEFDPGSER